MSNDNLYKCLDCGKNFIWESIKDTDFCPNCEEIWLNGESTRYGELLGTKKKCNLCNLEKDLINFRTINNKGKFSRQNECRQCHLIIRRKINNCKSHHRPHFYLLNKNIVYLKINSDIALFDFEDFNTIKNHSWFIWYRKRSKTRYLRGEMENGKFIYIHQLIITNVPDGKIIDHKNHNGLDNRKENLRFATGGQNVINSGKRITNTSGYKGVSFRKDTQKWAARITHNYKEINLGCYRNPIEAAHIYDKKALELFGEFAYLNLPSKPLEDNHENTDSNIDL
ncbi:MAG: HNH endonuclease [bacterium]|nr:HNH endonuclease [bacterium]